MDITKEALRIVADALVYRRMTGDGSLNGAAERLAREPTAERVAALDKCLDAAWAGQGMARARG